jgi:hypothetical protein
MIHLIIAFIIINSLSASGQHIKVKLKTNEIIYTDRIIIADFNNLRPSLVVLRQGKKVPLNAVNEIFDSTLNLTYKTFRFRKQVRLARIIENGKICLYDLHEPDSRRVINNRSISTNNRFYYNKSGDSVLYILNKKNYGKLFDSSFVVQYPDFEPIKTKYLRLHTNGILASVLLPNLITAAGFQSVALLVPYIAVTAFVTSSSIINRRKKLNDVRQMIKDFNLQSL